MATVKPAAFNEVDQLALRATGWRVTSDTADRAWRGNITATVRAAGSWCVVEKGETVAIGAGENPIVSALAALATATALKARRLLGEMA